jgi:hypothetical protein
VPDLSALAAALIAWLGDASARAAAGQNAAAVVRDGLGAAERSLAIVESLLGLA